VTTNRTYSGEVAMLTRSGGVGRRQFLRLAASAAALPAVSRVAWAQAYPTRPVRVIIGFTAGGPPDFYMRLLAEWLSDRLGQPFVIEHRPGAGGNIGTEAVVKALPDGHTLLFFGAGPAAINATLYEKLNFVFLRDIAPIAGIIRVPQAVHMNPSVPAETIPELIGYAKANPRKLNFASLGNGSGAHVAGELFKMMAGVDMVHVPYRGVPPALTDLLSGQVQVMFTPPVDSIGHIRAGRLRALALTTAARWEGLPELPIVGDFLPGYETSTWFGIGAPMSTPAAIIDKLNREINAGLADPKIKARLAEQGSILAGSPADFRKLIAGDTEKWAKVIRAANIRPE
jgi:tripartite-type tricarboxylate transporter receptor subunit TctC